MVVSTAIAFNCSPFGFSANSIILPSSSIFIRPNAVARFSSIGRAATVISASVSLCA
uniref:Gpm823 n=1 Tax=Arundo donax TaxID=35708 RepID=A0A0A9E104_ARUDO